jgi:septum site-determining protein MinC
MKAMDIAEMTDNALKSQTFKLKGRLYTLTVLTLLNADKLLLAEQLADIVTQAPRLFNHTPVVIDCSSIPSDAMDLQGICQIMREHGLVPVAVQGGDAMLETLAQCQGLAIVHASSHHDKPILPEKTTENETNIEPIRNRLITAPVRSGQQVVSKADLVITAAVSHGAELLADGSIHVYGALRGRALAGIAGDKNARIFCQSLEAELVAIAGYYRLSDAIEPQNGPCQIYLQDDHILIEPL